MLKIYILAGGFGTRLNEYTKTIPKPMIKIKGKPILLHLLEKAENPNFDIHKLNQD